MSGKLFYNKQAVRQSRHRTQLTAQKRPDKRRQAFGPWLAGDTLHPGICFENCAIIFHSASAPFRSQAEGTRESLVGWRGWLLSGFFASKLIPPLPHQSLIWWARSLSQRALNLQSILWKIRWRGGCFLTASSKSREKPGTPCPPHQRRGWRWGEKTKWNEIFRWFFSNSPVLRGTGRSNDTNCPPSKFVRLEIISAGFFKHFPNEKRKNKRLWSLWGKRHLHLHLQGTSLRDAFLPLAWVGCIFYLTAALPNRQRLNTVRPSLCHTKAPVTPPVFQENAGRSFLTFQRFFFVSFWGLNCFSRTFRCFKLNLTARSCHQQYPNDTWRNFFFSMYFFWHYRLQKTTDLLLLCVPEHSSYQHASSAEVSNQSR